MNAVNELIKVDFGTMIVSVCVVLVSFKFLYELLDWFSRLLGIETKKMREKREEHELLINTANALKELSEKQAHDVSESIKHDKAIRNELEKISNSFTNLSIDLSEVSKEVTLIRTQRNEDKLAEFKDKIGESYRFYKTRRYSDEQPIPYWNHMEKEALKGLITRYEEHGGTNSFVHSVVEPEMEKWLLVD